MKVEIDINELLEDEFGNKEGFAQAIFRQVSDAIRLEMKSKIDKEIEKTIQTILADKLSEIIKKTADEMLDMKYFPVTEYGKKGEETCLRVAIHKAMVEQMVYKRCNYESDKNAFSKAVDRTLDTVMKSFEDDFRKEVTDRFRLDAIQFALAELNKRFGVKI